MLTKFLAAISLAVVSIAAPAPMAASANPLEPNGNLKILTARSDLWDYQNDKIRGVNLGGWFVLEPYITPTLFQAFEDGSDQSNVPVDEYHYTKQLGKDLAFSRLDAHWSGWYIEDDFENMQALGLNFVRIPIGYWAFKLLPNDPYVQGQTKYLDRALGWCRKYNLKAWIDLHGAPESQNGFDNSGLRDHIGFQQGDNTDVTLEVLGQIVKEYGQGNWSDVVIGIELLNEPLGPELDMDKLKQFYYDGYDQVRKGGSYTPVIIHDAFQDFGYWNNELTVQNGDYWDVVVDHHHYQVFSPEQVSYDIGKHIQIACTWGWDAKKESHWNVAGEWSAALTDCALWLNGVGRGARWSGDYDNSPKYGSCAPYTDIKNWPSDYKTNVRKYIEAQLDAFEQTGGWVFWNWKTENAPEWDFQRLSSNGYFPQPLDLRKFPNQCNFPN